MKQDKDYKQQEKTMKPWKITVAQILFLAAILALQEYVVVKGYVSSLFLAAPSGIAASLLELFSGSDLFHHLLITLLEFVAGFSLSVVVGIVLGVFLATLPALDTFLKPYISFAMSIPKVAIIPLITLWLGLGPVSKVFVVFVFSVFPILFNTVAGVRQTSVNHIKVARTLEASKYQITMKVFLPSAMPTIFASLHVAAATAIVGAVFAEMLGARAGIGTMLSKASQLYETGELFALIIIITVFSILVTQIITFIEKKIVLKWQS